MKPVSLTLLRVFILLAALMVWQAKSAEAHGLDHSATYEVPAQTTHVAPETSVSKSETTIVKSAASFSQEDNCKGGCCSSMGMCCFAAAIPPYPFDLNIVRDAFAAGLPELSLPQGPPSSLLRPPRFSA